MLIHGKDLTKPNLVSGIIPSPIPVDRVAVQQKKPSLLAFANWFSPLAERGGAAHDDVPLLI